ncbi:MAG TPA: GNAT family N-acetyltransferase [Chitinophagaceae bacterium]|nr:GNAT family N-acetyltransferase [Chitinophagaceae bacterium]
MMHELSNPAWESLCSRQKQFNQGDEEVRFYPENVSPFIALKNWDEQDIQTLIERELPDRSFSMVVEKQVQLPPSFDIIFAIPLYQMVCTDLKRSTKNGVEIQNLSYDHVPQMLELTAMTRPGPFYERTIDFGNYIGIFEKEKLVAMAGERMKLSGYTEVSAICTHPDHLGKGYASMLFSKASERIVDEGNKPFLHVKKDNAGAIRIYEKFGYNIRSEMFFTVFKKKSS